ncbi:hypothetical protein ACIRJR_22660 [Streptomyces sp. NPDC102402]|uniref:hypothetical protein n=1 Tax=Streptomyces sp. NPDC102402 TaxID=3366169 RepID=UPI00381DEAF6
MTGRTSRLAASIVSTGLLAAATVALTPTSAAAAAASNCSAKQHKQFDTVGENLDLYITLCVSRTSSNYYQATVHVAWEDGGNGSAAGMEDLDVNLRLERNDSAYKTASSSYKNPANTYDSGSGYGHVTSTYYSTSTGGWTADGSVNWDINNDGAGGGTWQLTGSGQI